MPNEKVNTLTGRERPLPNIDHSTAYDITPEPQHQPDPSVVVMPDKLKDAINRRRDDCNKRLQAAEQRESAAFQEAAMTLVQGWLCSMELEGKVSVDLDSLTVTLQP